MGTVIEHDFGHVQPEDEGHQPPLQDPALCPHPQEKADVIYRCSECGAETVVFKGVWK